MVGIYNSIEKSQDHSSQQAIPAPSDLTVHGESFELKGISYHIEFQDTIRRCRANLNQNEPVVTRIDMEPDNGLDKNAIVVQVFKQGHWKTIGYVPGPKVPKVFTASHKNELISTTFQYVTRSYNHALQQFIYIPTITILKYGRWLPNDKNYQYNQNIFID